MRRRVYGTCLVCLSTARITSVSNGMALLYSEDQIDKGFTCYQSSILEGLYRHLEEFVNQCHSQQQQCLSLQGGGGGGGGVGEKDREMRS